MTDKSKLTAERLRIARDKKQWSYGMLSDATGFSKSTLQRYETGFVSNIPVERLKIIGGVLGVRPEWLMGFDENDSTNKNQKGYSVPVLGYVRAGIPIEAVEEILDYEEISQELANTGDFFALKIKGDSMEPKISEGDVVIVRKQEQVENGELAVVLVNGNDATVKRFYMNESGVTLISSNPSYPPFIYSKEQVSELPVSVIGKVVELRAKF
jgi:repressor LexA